MKERPIIFGTESIKAILDGRKTQTRRLNSLKNINNNPDQWKVDYLEHGIAGFRNTEKLLREIKCPYGKVGGQLWVREKLESDGATWMYSADRKFITLQKSDPKVPEMISWAHHKKTNYCSAIYMPRWASRIDLEIVDIRVERLQDISAYDIEQEIFVSHYPCEEPTAEYEGVHRCKEGAKNDFMKGWDEINPKYPWESNPWVWVITTKPINGAASIQS